MNLSTLSNGANSGLRDSYSPTRWDSLRTGASKAPSNKQRTKHRENSMRAALFLAFWRPSKRTRGGTLSKLGRYSASTPSEWAFNDAYAPSLPGAAVGPQFDNDRLGARKLRYWPEDAALTDLFVTGPDGLGLNWPGDC